VRDLEGRDEKKKGKDIGQHTPKRAKMHAKRTPTAKKAEG